MASLSKVGAQNCVAVYAPEQVSPRLETRVLKKITEQCVMQGTPITWDPSRLVTPGSLCGYQTERELRVVKFDNTSDVRLFTQGKESQGLLRLNEQVAAASVTTTIVTQTARKNEAKSTTVQYNKNRVEQANADFTVKAQNHKKNVNYQGGHLIDHKFSAEGSHDCVENYIPEHFMYNAPIKEYLVQHSEAYIEIPLYTPNPPTIGVMDNRQLSHPIPVGIIFIQLKDKKIADVYYFPNAFDYHDLKIKLSLKKDIAKTIAPYFKLEKCFHPLLQAACITDVRTVPGGMLKQKQKEDEMFVNLSMVADSALLDHEEDRHLLGQVVQEVLYSDAVDPFLLLDCSEEMFSQIDEDSLTPAFNALGHFLIREGLKNALKSEVLSVKSRLVFLNLVIDFFENASVLAETAVEFMVRLEGPIDLEGPFATALKELKSASSTMNAEELVFFAQTCQRMCSPFAVEGEVSLIWEMEDGFRQLIRLLKIVSTKEMSDWTFNVVHLFVGAQEAYEHLLLGFSEKEELVEEAEFLRGQREVCLKHLKTLSNFDGQTHTKKMHPMRDQLVKTGATYTRDYLQPIIERLGS